LGATNVAKARQTSAKKRVDPRNVHFQGIFWASRAPEQQGKILSDQREDLYLRIFLGATNGAKARQTSAKKRSLDKLNEHFSPIFNAVFGPFVAPKTKKSSREAA